MIKAFCDTCEAELPPLPSGVQVYITTADRKYAQALYCSMECFKAAVSTDSLPEPKDQAEP